MPASATRPTGQLGGLWTIQSVRSSSITYSLEASIEHELTFGLDHLVGADQFIVSRRGDIVLSEPKAAIISRPTLDGYSSRYI